MRVNVRRTAVLTGVTAMIGMALAGGIMAAPAMAAGPYNATAAGFPGNTPLVALATSSVQPVVVSNLPANVGVYVLHCKVPADPRQAPTACDGSTDALAYVPATTVLRDSVTIPVKVNGEFFGTNPNPTAGPAVGESVDCRVPTGNPRSTTCALYLLGAGRDAANPAYLRVWPTVFSAVKADRKTDAATITVGGKVVEAGTAPSLKANVATPLKVTTTSGLVPTLSADNCSVTGGNITALAATGVCTLRITTTGGKNFLPLVTTQVFSLS